MNTEIISIGYKDENDNPQEQKVGENVKKITGYFPRGEGDRLYYEIYFADQTIVTVFNPIIVRSREVEEDKPIIPF